MHKIHQNFLATCLYYGSYASVMLFAIGFVLNLIWGHSGHSQCFSFLALFSGMVHFNPICWYALGAYILLGLPMLTLLLIMVLAFQGKNIPLAIMAIVVLVLILGASFIPH